MATTTPPDNPSAIPPSVKRKGGENKGSKTGKKARTSLVIPEGMDVDGDSVSAVAGMSFENYDYYLN